MTGHQALWLLISCAIADRVRRNEPVPERWLLTIDDKLYEVLPTLAQIP